MSYATVRGGLGAAAPITNNDFMKLMVDASNAVTTTQDVVQHLTPPALQQALMVNASITATAGMSPEEILSHVASEVLPKLFPQFIQTLKGISEELFGPGGNYAWVGEEIGASIPLIGTIVSLVIQAFDPSKSAWGLPCHSGDINNRAVGCRSLYRVPVGSGPGGMMMPCDLFASSWDGTGSPPSPPSLNDPPVTVIDGAFNDVGQAFINSFEGGYGCEDINTPLCAILSPMTVASDGSYPLPMGFQIPKDTWVVIRKLRRAIQASYGRGDGGSALWPIYLDIVNYQWRSGRVTGPDLDFWPGRSAATMNRMHAWWCKEMGTALPLETCFSHDTRGFDQMVGMLNGWDQTIHSSYSQYQIPQMTEAQMLAKAKLLLQKRVAINPSTLINFFPTKKPTFNFALNPALAKIVLQPKKTTHPYLVAGGIAGAAALLWFFL